MQKIWTPDPMIEAKRRLKLEKLEKMHIWIINQALLIPCDGGPKYITMHQFPTSFFDAFF